MFGVAAAAAAITVTVTVDAGAAGGDTAVAARKEGFLTPRLPPPPGNGAFLRWGSLRCREMGLSYGGTIGQGHTLSTLIAQQLEPTYKNSR